MKAKTILVAILGILALCGSAWALDDMVSHWKFDEGSGAIAYDSAGTNDGTIYGGPTWTAGLLGGALDFDGSDDYVSIPHDPSLNITGDITIAAWIFFERGGVYEGIVTKCVGSGSQDVPYDFRTQGLSQPRLTFVRADASGHERVYSSTYIPTGQWHYVLIRVENKVPDFYIDGVITGKYGDVIFTRTPTGNTKPVLIGRRDDGLYFDGLIDDVRIYDRALFEQEIQQLYHQGRTKAVNPYPPDGATGIDPNVVLGWTPGYNALSHDVYFGTSYADVNDAYTFSDEYKGNYDVNSYDPCGLDFDTIYYWRIDEVNEPNIVKGNVWSFTTRSEPNIISWWKFDEGSGATAYDSAGSNDGTINGATWTSGQIGGALDFDGVDDYVDMADTVKNYLETSYTFSAWIKTRTILGVHGIAVYRRSTFDIGYQILLQLQHNNSDVQFIVSSLGNNAIASYPDALTINTWYHVAGVREGNILNVYVNGVSGTPDSETFGTISPDNFKIGANDCCGHGIDSFFDGAIDDVMIFNSALSAQEIWGIFRTGMSNKAFAPHPADAATNVDPNVVLSWTPGKDVVWHDVYFGTSYEDVNDANTTVTLGVYKSRQDVNNYDPNDLQLGQTYYWRIDEVNDTNEEIIWKGDVWTFTTRTQFIPDLVSWWMFDEGEGSTAYDSAGNNDGTIYGATWTTGQINGALSFDGPDYVSVPHDPTMNITGDITISAWIYLTQGSSNQGIVTKCAGGGSRNNPYDFRTNNYAEPLLAFVRADASGHERVYSSKPITIGQWYHALVRVENKVPDFYVNGIITGKGSDIIFTKTPTGNTKPVLIGRRSDGLYFNGSIDDVHIYDRALSEEEIWEIYQSSWCEPGYPCINVWPETLEFYADQGGSNPQPQILSISNFGADILNYHITEDCSWLEVDPNAGSSAGEPNEVTVSVDISGLNCGLYECDLIVSDPNASNNPQIVNVQLEVFREECLIDVRVAPVAVLTDPATTSEVRTILPNSIPGVVTGNTFYVEIWASDVGATNTGLTGVYVDVDFYNQTTALAVEHGTIFVTFPDGTIQPGGVDEFGGSALPSGGGIEPNWVRVGWIQMNANAEVQTTCTISLLPSSTGIAALNRGAIPWISVDLGSVELEITPPARSYDLDGDNFIGLSDLSFFAGSWKQSVPPANEQHDFDCDGSVGIGDLSWFATGWQKPTNDPTILYPPCAAGAGAAWLLNNSALEMQNSDVFQTSIPTNIDIAFSLAVLDSPSSSETTITLPTSVKKISAGQTYYLELWIRDSGYINTGLTSAYVDLSFPAYAATVTDVSYNSIFTLFNEESVLSGKIDELGGSSLPGGDGIEPEWARVAVVQIQADATLPFVIFTLSPSSLGVAALGRGTIPWNDISLGTLLICPADFDNDADVDGKDLAIFSSAFHTRPGDPQWNSDCDITTPTGYIDRFDLAWVVDSWLIGIVP